MDLGLKDWSQVWEEPESQDLHPSRQPLERLPLGLAFHIASTAVSGGSTPIMAGVATTCPELRILTKLH
ncbi:hypothetical protein PRBEI_2000511700 [Prionailurus iriomotensis]